MNNGNCSNWVYCLYAERTGTSTSIASRISDFLLVIALSLVAALLRVDFAASLPRPEPGSGKGRPA
ncbi:MAG: hypothetical protein ABR587_02120 [Candidatus Binatia bacterium]